MINEQLEKNIRKKEILMYLSTEFHIHEFIEERHTKTAEEHYQR